MIRALNLFIILFLSIGILNHAMAHPMPNSLVLLNIQDDAVKMEVQLPVQEFELAYGRNLREINNQYLIDNHDSLVGYLLNHTKIYSGNQQFWKIMVDKITLESTTSELNGTYKELRFELTCIPPSKNFVRSFALQYDAIIHQVVTHFAIIKINQDFNNGVVALEPMEIGIIQLDITSNTVKPLNINIDTGSKWNGIKKMVMLGMHHILVGIDHLLFLFVMMLIAPLLHDKQKWLNFGGTKYTFIRILKIVTAFTLGHSATLMIVSFSPIPNFSQSIEIGITFTILISALHALKPIFAERESTVTFIFGLIHGSAFASTLYNLQLNTSLKLLSILGFNLGIEIMQLGIILLIVPILFLSKFKGYKYVRYAGAICAIIASIAWIFDRISNKSNAITDVLNNLI